ncbi:MAG: type II secretion system protein [Epulopiscium sp.]|nr:type II secretion system protein [Candidatus Epulonipiscium sp.]
MLKNEKGFTIMELVLIILLTALFVSGALYTRKQVGRRQLYSTARDIQTLIRVAQDGAYGEQNVHGINFYPNSQECVHIRNYRIVKEIKIPNTIKMEPTSFPNNKLRFSSKLSPSRGGTIKLCSRSHEVRITVLPVTGRVKIYPIQRKRGN